MSTINMIIILRYLTECDWYSIVKTKRWTLENQNESNILVLSLSFFTFISIFSQSGIFHLYGKVGGFWFFFFFFPLDNLTTSKGHGRFPSEIFQDTDWSGQFSATHRLQIGFGHNVPIWVDMQIVISIYETHVIWKQRLT